MTTTNEKIAELKRLLADNLRKRVFHVHATTLASLLADLESAQKREQVLREAVKRAVPWMNKFINDDRHIETVSPSDCLASKQMLLDALAATEVQP